jgi:glycerol kinase
VSSRYIAAIDQGTTSTRCILFDRHGRLVSIAQKEHRQSFPRPGWVEHDPMEIWRNTIRVVNGAVRKAGADQRQVVALGVANQRETTVIWDRSSGLPVAPAITWQDTRTNAMAQELRSSPLAKRVHQLSGLQPEGYYAGLRLRWLLDHVPGLEPQARGGEVLAGTIDSWLIWKLTGGGAGTDGRHVTDVTNASRTLLMDIDKCQWHPELLSGLGLPEAMLPEIRPSLDDYGNSRDLLPGTRIGAALGDQQAALFGQRCFNRGQTKCTLGSGSFLLMNTGAKRITSRSGLISTVGYQIRGHDPVYAHEGSIAVTGSLVQWLRDGLGLIRYPSEVETLALTVPDNGGCYLVPAFAGLFAPHWQSEARGVVVGLTGFITKGHIARAALEATAWQAREVADALTADTGIVPTQLRVDGGMTANNLLMQMLADALDVEVTRSMVTETVALGAAYAAGVSVGFWADPAVLPNAQPAGRWLPQMDATRRENEHRRWRRAVQRALDWNED